MFIIYIPYFFNVDNIVENFKNYKHLKNLYVYMLYINMLYTLNSQYTVDIKSTYSVRRKINIFSKQLFFQTIFLKNFIFYLYLNYYSGIKIFLTLSTINFVFLFSLISFSILLQACITVV